MNDFEKFIFSLGAIGEIMGVMYTALVKQGVPPDTATAMAENMAQWLLERK